MRGVYYRTEKDGTALATPELRISATNNRTVYYDDQTAKEAAMQAGEIKEGSIVLTGYADGEAEVLMKQNVDWANKVSITEAQLAAGYAVPSDGIVIVAGRGGNNVGQWVTINGDHIGYYYNSNNTETQMNASVQIQVNKGDVVATTNTMTANFLGTFVPFKTVAEPMTLPVNINAYEDKYSLTEYKTNKTWIDGRPIYRKVFTGLSITTAQGTWTNIIPISQISNATTIINLTLINEGTPQMAYITRIASGYLQVDLAGLVSFGLQGCIVEYAK